MTKDEQIAMLQETIAILRADRASMIVTLQMALDRIPPCIERSAGAERQARYRAKRNEALQSDATNAASPNVTEASLGVTEVSPGRNGSDASPCELASSNHNGSDAVGDYRGRTFPFGEEPSTDPENQETELESQGKVLGKPNVTEVTPSDAEWDAFRAIYPNLNRRTNWTKTRPVWNRLSRANKPLAVLGAKNYAACRDVARSCEMAAKRWLDERRWESWQEPEELLPSQGDDRPAGAAGIQAWRDRQVAAGLMEAREPEKWTSFEMPA